MVYPNYSLFLSWSRKHSVIPFYYELPFPRSADPWPYFLRESGNLESTFFLDSFNAVPGGRFTYFPGSPALITFKGGGHKESLRAWESLESCLERMRGPGVPARLPPFYGGAVGFLSYDCGRGFENGWKSKSPPDL